MKLRNFRSWVERALGGKNEKRQNLAVSLASEFCLRFVEFFFSCLLSCGSFSLEALYTLCFGVFGHLGRNWGSLVMSGILSCSLFFSFLLNTVFSAGIYVFLVIKIQLKNLVILRYFSDIILLFYTLEMTAGKGI